MKFLTSQADKRLTLSLSIAPVQLKLTKNKIAYTERHHNIFKNYRNKYACIIQNSLLTFMQSYIFIGAKPFGPGNCLGHIGDSAIVYGNVAVELYTMSEIGMIANIYAYAYKN